MQVLIAPLSHWIWDLFEVLKIGHEEHNERDKVNDDAMASPKWPLKPNGKPKWKCVKM